MSSWIKTVGSKGREIEWITLIEKEWQCNKAKLIESLFIRDFKYGVNNDRQKFHGSVARRCGQYAET